LRTARNSIFRYKIRPFWDDGDAVHTGKRGVSCHVTFQYSLIIENHHANEACERLNNRAQARSARVAANRAESDLVSYQRTDSRAVERGETLTQLVAKNHNYFLPLRGLFARRKWSHAHF
jgi:hypothetical protein